MTAKQPRPTVKTARQGTVGYSRCGFGTAKPTQTPCKYALSTPLPPVKTPPRPRRAPAAPPQKAIAPPSHCHKTTPPATLPATSRPFSTHFPTRLQDTSEAFRPHPAPLSPRSTPQKRPNTRANHTSTPLQKQKHPPDLSQSHQARKPYFAIRRNVPRTRQPPPQRHPKSSKRPIHSRRTK